MGVNTAHCHTPWGLMSTMDLLEVCARQLERRLDCREGAAHSTDTVEVCTLHSEPRGELHHQARLDNLSFCFKGEEL